ncbi:hypothetical protein BJX64DRAFT_270308 [Aspergillus heterothallicus]
MNRPFRCQIAGCNASYVRKEHLTRHQAKHAQSQSFTCPTCAKEFGRSDTLRRHIRHSHGESSPISRIRACTNCRTLKTRCDGGSPCRECLRRQIACSLRSSTPPSLAPGSSRLDKEKRAIDVYFTVFHPHWPFVHQASFHNYGEGPLLVKSIVAIGLWATGEESARSAAVQLHKVLGSAILDQRGKWECPHPDRVSDSAWPIPTFQAILLYILLSLLSKGTVPIGLDLKPTLAAAEMELLASLVATCRHLGMFYYPKILEQYANDHVKAYIWIGVEEIKRFNLALFRVCRSVSSSGDRCRLAATELQFPLPTGERLWSAVTSADWHAEAAKEGTNLDKTRGPAEPWISELAELVRCIDPECGFL